VGFWGDYLYVSAVPGAVNVTWTDSRDLVPGADPREIGADDDEDEFDVLQPCTYVPNDINAPSYSSPAIDDPCLSQGGLDENIYAAWVSEAGGGPPAPRRGRAPDRPAPVQATRGPAVPFDRG
jgi:hypothetical protein